VEILTKIHIIGAPGSGKTYIAKKLSKKLRLPMYTLDHLFWDSESSYQGSQTPPAKRDQLLKQIIEKENWIVEGVYYRWVKESFINADYIIVLKTNVRIRRWRIIKSFIFRKLRLRPSIRRETFRTLLELLDWNNSYDEQDLVEAVKLLKTHNDKVIILTKYKDIHKLIRRKNTYK
jgi:adenylate kinase family enzyme